MKSFIIPKELSSYKENILSSLSIIINFFEIKKLKKNLFLGFCVPNSRGSLINFRTKSKKLVIIDESYNSNPLSFKFALERFNSIIKYLPLQYKDFKPEDKYVLAKDNPPSVEIKFFDNQKNVKNINCFSNEGDNWGNPNISIDEKNIMKISFREKFSFRRGRLNCSLNENGKWKWFGHQFTIQIPK